MDILPNNSTNLTRFINKFVCNADIFPPCEMANDKLGCPTSQQKSGKVEGLQESPILKMY